MPPRDANVDHMLHEVIYLGKGLTAWEEEFIEKMYDQWTRTHKISDFQFDKLTEIYQVRVR